MNTTHLALREGAQGMLPMWLALNLYFSPGHVVLQKLVAICPFIQLSRRNKFKPHLCVFQEILCWHLGHLKPCGSKSGRYLYVLMSCVGKAVHCELEKVVWKISMLSSRELGCGSVWRWTDRTAMSRAGSRPPWEQNAVSLMYLYMELSANLIQLFLDPLLSCGCAFNWALPGWACLMPCQISCLVSTGLGTGVLQWLMSKRLWSCCSWKAACLRKTVWCLWRF